MSEDKDLIITKGTVVAGRYEVVATIGTGSMGVVYRCTDLESGWGRAVALKVLFPELARDQTLVQRFRNEISAAHDVVHRNIVRPYDYIEDGKLKAYTMEFVEGIDLASILSRKVVLPISEVANLLLQMCLGVQAIHDANIVHRDLKPENIMVTVNGDVKIMDFGIARADSGRKLTARGSILGTLEYMSPEYLADGTVHPLGDIYSLGAVAYQLVAGKMPHDGKTMVDLVNAKVKKDPEPPRTLRADCPLGLNNMIMKALSRDMALRYHSACHLYRDLLTLNIHGTSVRLGTGELRHANKQRNPTVPIPEKVYEPVAGTIADATNSVHTEAPAMQPKAGWRSFASMFCLAIIVIAGGICFAGLQDTYSLSDLKLLTKLDAKSLGLFKEQKTVAMLKEEAMEARKNRQKNKYTTELPLFIQAVVECNYEEVASLAETLPTVDVSDSGGDTALAWAAKNNCLAVANLLIDRGADVNAKSKIGMTPYSWAKEYQNEDIVNLLVHSGANSLQN